MCIRDRNNEINDLGRQRDSEKAFIRSEMEQLLTEDFDIYEKDDFREQNLPARILKIQRVGSVLPTERHDAVVQALHFHKNNDMFLSAGYDKTIKIFDIRRAREKESAQDGVKCIKTIYTKGLPLQQVRFLFNKNEVVCSGLKRHLLSFDIVKETFEKISNGLFTSRFDKPPLNFAVSKDEQYIAVFGDTGYVIVLSGNTKQKLFEVKMNEPCSAVAFSPDSKYLVSSGKGGKIYQWDLSKRAIFDCFHDNGSLHTNCLTFSENGAFLSSGTSSGIINVYACERTSGKIAKKPVKEITNLTTSISGVTFNAASEILAGYSKWKNNAVRLVHFPSLTTFSNWPNFRTNLKLISALEFSSNCKHMVVGNEEGNIHLYNMEHYGQYRSQEVEVRYTECEAEKNRQVSLQILTVLNVLRHFVIPYLSNGHLCQVQSCSSETITRIMVTLSSLCTTFMSRKHLVNQSASHLSTYTL
eukprot:TRINITY_DN9888_c0_g1_i4.p1 TRINITY_DN9888_c0_g1~~TRINITY_DN9888_c0_g1_i4.p1  ORF type:complete len:490 (+),score=76.98 TRINITY_DN9888_c0_g1_i4:60-1472(+)